MNKMVKTLKKKIEKKKNKIKELEEQLVESYRDETLYFPCCDKTQRIRDTIKVISEYYVAPYSCSGGDYWKDDDTLYFQCNSCKQIVRYWDEYRWKVPYTKQDLLENNVSGQFNIKFGNKNYFFAVIRVKDRDFRSRHSFTIDKDFLDRFDLKVEHLEAKNDRY